MLTYKLIKKESNIYTYKYFPYGKDINVEGGVISIDIETRKYRIESVAQLDNEVLLTEGELNQIVQHINSIRQSSKFPLLTTEEIDNFRNSFEFADIFIEEIYKQIQSNNIKEKGIVT